MIKRNEGFTLVELLVVAVLGTLILTAVYQTLTTQQRTFRHQSAVIDTHEASRTALEVLAAELREVSSSGADITMATPESVTVRALRKAGIVCFVPVASLYLDVWSLGTDFVQDDDLLVYDNGGTTDDPADDQWRSMTVTTADTSLYNLAGCTQWPEYSLTGDSVGDHTRAHLTVSGSILGTIARGAPVRSFEAVTYGIGTIDGEWTLTRREGGGAVVGLVGPLAAPADSGLFLTYFDANGTEIPAATLAGSLTAINSFKINVKGTSPSGGGENVERDLSISIYLRNNDPAAMGW